MNLDHLFHYQGAYALFDGQYGSTGKGLAAVYFAEHTTDGLFGAVMSNAGPNSGHTFYAQNGDTPTEEKVVLKQLPSFSVYQKLRGRREPITVLTAGAVIDPVILSRECNKYYINPFVHPNAALITPGARDADKATVSAIASTGQGVGPAIMNKMQRIGGINNVALSLYPNAKEYVPNLRNMRVLLEISQGFSLGLNQPFYPHVTSRECSVAQAMADAGLSPWYYRGGVMCIRTFPIRVGNAPSGASSGDCYPDQRETSWGEIGVEPELTTVTKRVRRVFTFSWMQYRDALRVNTPSVVFANFLNYIDDSYAVNRFVDKLRSEAYDVLGYHVTLIGGWGPRVTDCAHLGD